MPTISELPLANSVDSDDLFIVEKDGTTSHISFNDLLGGGVLSGPSESVDNTLARFSGPTGGVIQGSNVTVDDTGNLTTSGTIAASNVTGTNTGDQTITLEGDVTGTGTGTFTATISNDTVTFAKMQNLSANVLLGRTGTSGDPEEIPCTAFARTLLDDTNASTARSTLGLVIGTDVQAYSTVLQNTTASFTTADESKLDGIEAGATADQTAEEIQDAAWTVLGGTQTGITVTYQDVTNDVDFVVNGLTTTEFASANVSQWTNDVNYTTNASAIDAVEAANNTFTGNNTFNNPLTVATATGPTHAVTKAQLDALGIVVADGTAAGSITFAEDTDNGSNTVTITAPASVTAGRTITLPDADGTVGLLTSNTVETISKTATSASVGTGGDTALGPTVSITMGDASNKVAVKGCYMLDSGTDEIYYYTIYKDGSPLAAYHGASVGSRQTVSGAVDCKNGRPVSFSFYFEDEPADTSAHTYEIRFSARSTQTLYINQASIDSNSNQFGRGSSWIIAEEIAQ